jgi:DNA-binding NarL/FixJ family response regulator
MTIRALIVEEHRPSAETLESALRDAGISVVASVRTGAEAIEFLADHSADVILLDLGQPSEDGLLTGKRIIERWPGSRIVAMGAGDERNLISLAVHIGFRAYLVKDIPLDRLARVVGAVAGDEEGFPFTQRSRSGVDDPTYGLTPGERDVLGLLAEGLTSRAIAPRLGMSTSEARSYVQSILEKLNADRRDSAITIAIGEEPDPSTDHPHLTPMTHEQLLSHLRSMHARGTAPFNPLDFDNHREVHAKLHRQPPPASA